MNNTTTPSLEQRIDSAVEELAQEFNTSDFGEQTLRRVLTRIATHAREEGLESFKHFAHNRYCSGTFTDRDDTWKYVYDKEIDGMIADFITLKDLTNPSKI